MMKILVLAMVVCVARAGVLGLGGHGVAVVHGATSYQNHNQISVHPVPVVATHAVHAVQAAPVAIGLGGHGGLGLH
ncbi:hypothetical protein NQ318_006093 [Aromia moschata]|uniref:Secreted protein n=1 Tax=Aromia moschata TaxID=1265417 RepID=A0AAV8Z4T5_9CUCU|nr:hypothetical protein NQ318_006093 [Aromia moschata]